MQQFKRVAAMLLCLVMLFSCVPMGVFAADSDSKVVDAAVIFSDLHTSKFDYKPDTLQGIMTALKNTGLPFSSVTSAGDAFSVNADSTKYTGNTSTITGYIQGVLGNVPVNYVWSDHDRYAVEADGTTLLNKTSRLVYGAGNDGVYGTADDGNYYIYSLSMADLCSYDRYITGFNYTETSNNRAANGYTATVAEAIENFKADAAKLNKDRPLFITSHQPLFDNRNDNAFAEDWFDAINEVAAEMDVAFFYGHNHNYDTASDYYYAKGSKMNVATADNWNWNYEVGQGWKPSVDLTFEQKTLNFTHMCAGYMDPASTGSTSSTTREGVAVAITIYEDAINYTTYSNKGVYTDNYALNETVDRAHAKTETPEATEPETTAPAVVEKKDETTGITVSALGITGVTVGTVAADHAVFTAVASVLKNSVAYDIEAADYTDGTQATVTLPVPAGVTDPAVYYVSDDAKNVTDMKAVKSADGTTVSFVTDHFSYYVIGENVTEAAEGSVTIKNVTPTETKTVYVRVNSLTNGGKYLIVNSDVSQALKNDNGADASVSVTKISGNVTVGGTTYSDYIENPDSGAIWTAATYSTGFDLTNGGEHLIARKSTSDMISSSGSAWTYSGSNLRAKSGNTTYYVRYSNGDWSNTSSSTSASTVYLYKQETVQIATSGDVTYSMQASDLKHRLVDNNKNAQLHYGLLANGVAATLPVGGSYTFGVAGDTNGIISAISDDGIVTFTGETGSCRVKVAYTWTDGDQTYTVYKYVTVSVVTPNNYPEYPDEGAVKVGKTGTGIDFQSSGIAQVEISASGIPIKKGADVIVMVDTSSSMERHIDCGKKSCSDTSCSKVTRQAELVKALNALVTVFQTKDESGDYRDLKVAFADFNGFFGDQGDTKFEGQTVSGTTPYDLDSGDYTDRHFSANGSVHVIQGSSLDYGAFMTPAQMTGINFGEFEMKSGTNYDYAFDVIYQLGHAARKHNADNGEDRDLYVIFMSDGAPNQFNYFGAVGGNTGSSKLWDNWLLGSWNANDLNSSNLNSTTNKHYYDLNDHDHDGFINEHRMANAIKGSPDEMFEVIRKSTAGLTDLLPETHTNNLYQLPGLGATMYSIAFAPANDGEIDKESMLHALQQIASDQEGTTQYYYEVEASAGLADVFKGIGGEIAYAAYNARYVDQMGDDYNLQMATKDYTVVNDNNTTTQKTITPKIEIISYDINTRQDYLNGTITEDKIGDRKGTSTILETVTFNADGTEAYSDKKSGNILIDGVICAQTFWYNTKATAVAVEGVSIPTGTNADGTTTGSTNMLPSETFYWKMGTVKTSELAMRYYVYLDGSMEGTREGGSYPTNEYATLYYDNYLNNPCKKDTVSPVMAWKEANVSYAFYLVDENGNIIVNQTTGQTGSFANKIAVTNPVVYETVLLNSDEEVSSIDIASLGVLPEGYTLYDFDGDKTGATYTVTINSNTTGSWVITSVKDVATTYVTQYNPNDASAYSNSKDVSQTGLDYTHTIVWFAVVWKIQALPDTVVVDYGLPVDISVLRNDMFGDNGKLAGVGAYSNTLNLDGHDTTLASGFGTNYTGTYGSAKADASTGKVRYTPANMQMNGYDKFAYAVNYTGATNPGYYYDTVTVIPATTIYYEDNFLTYTASGTEWVNEGTATDGVTQAEDRPGRYSLTDANNIYGYDAAYANMSTFSLGTAKKVHVDANSYATASFTFYGTGFDVIGMTSNTTGVLAVKVTDANGNKVKATMVNTYYGYDYTLAQVKYTYTEKTDANGNVVKDANGNTVYEWVKTVYRAATAEEQASEGKFDTTKPGTVGESHFWYENAWIPTPDTENSLYQVPVMQIEDLPYGQYTVLITATYNTASDKTSADGYDLYLDAIRIYDPANDGASDGSDDTTIEDAYKADGEGWPSYIELRNSLIAAKTLGNTQTDTKVEGMVFIDGDEDVRDGQLSDYVSYGPNNEVYLAPGQRVAFLLNTPSNIKNVHIGIKSADGKAATYTITNIALNTNSETGVKAGDFYNAKTNSISTSTDMYYDLTSWKGDIIVISNTGDRYGTEGIISLTNIKSTYTSDPNPTAPEASEAQSLSNDSASTMSARNSVSGASVMTIASKVLGVAETADEETIGYETYIYMTPSAAALTLYSMNAEAEEDVPEETVPEESEPETTVPDETEPEETIPEETQPEETIPEETKPEETIPEETKPEDGENTGNDGIISTIIKIIGKLFGLWFG